MGRVRRGSALLWVRSQEPCRGDRKVGLLGTLVKGAGNCPVSGGNCQIKFLCLCGPLSVLCVICVQVSLWIVQRENKLLRPFSLWG